MKKQTGSRNRGWLPVIGNRLSVAAGVALAAGLLAAFALRAEAVVSATATGATETNYVVNSATIYKAFIFTTVGTNSITFASTGTVEYLVVAGGGGGGRSGGGGGGAGGYLAATTYSVTSTTYQVVVG